MEEKDIDAFLQAKRETVFTLVYSVVAVTLLALLILMEVSELYNEYTIAIATLAMVFSAGAGSPSRWVKVPRSRLLEIIENQINRDPEAVKLLAKKRKS